MARVITKPAVLKKTARLRHSCGAIVEFNQSDVQSDHTGGTYVVCPYCKAVPWVNATTLRWRNHPRPKKSHKPKECL